MPSLSIVTPSYNQEPFIESTLRSVLDQKYRGLEYIVADGSSDKSLDIIGRYQDSITHIITGENRGFGEALNTSFAKSTGEIMAWINSDDFYLPRAFDIVSRIFTECPEVEWLAGSSLICDSTGTPIAMNIVNGFSRPLFFSGRYLGGHPAWSGQWIPQESVFWRRSLWERAGGYFLTDRLQYGDFELWSRFWQHSELYALPVPLAAYRCHQDTYTSRQGKTSIKPCTQLIQASGLGKYRPSEIRWREIMCRLSNSIARRFGEPARMVQFDRSSNRWTVGTRFVM